MKRRNFLTISLVLFAVSLGASWAALAGTSQGDIVDKFQLKKWNGSYYCSVVFPDATRQELNSKTDLTFAGWQVLIAEAWKAHIAPPLAVEPTLAVATVEEIKAEIAKRKLTAADLGLAEKEIVK
jgi:uncharacterized iron-regulated membrane protein